MKADRKLHVLVVNFTLVLFTLTSNLLASNPAEEEALTAGKQHPIVGQIISKLLPRYHYNHQKVNDQLSSEVLDNYLERFDRQRMYFLASDIAEFEDFRYVLDDNIKSGDLDVAYKIFNRYRLRLDVQLSICFHKWYSPVRLRS